MPYCSKCGSTVPAAATFCQNCGQPQPVSGAAPVRSGMSENTAAVLSYVLGWLTGIIFLLIDKRPYVRFHAAQSIITFGGLHLVRMVIGAVLGVGWWFGGHGNMARIGIAWPLLGLISLLTLVLWVLLMVKASQGQKFKLPVAGDLAENWAGQSR
jgi:uncharacterized membrane protein